MSFLVRFNPDSLTAAQYDGVVRTLEEQGNWPPEGLELHVCFGSDGSLRVSEIWGSREQFDAFGELLQPLLEDAGIKQAGEPEFFDIHNMVGL